MVIRCKNQTGLQWTRYLRREERKKALNAKCWIRNIYIKYSSKRQHHQSKHHMIISLLIVSAVMYLLCFRLFSLSIWFVWQTNNYFIWAYDRKSKPNVCARVCVCRGGRHRCYSSFQYFIHLVLVLLVNKPLLYRSTSINGLAFVNYCCVFSLSTTIAHKLHFKCKIICILCEMISNVRASFRNHVYQKLIICCFHSATITAAWTLSILLKISWQPEIAFKPNYNNSKPK